jgi:hypothetical protein
MSIAVLAGVAVVAFACLLIILVGGMKKRGGG